VKIKQSDNFVFVITKYVAIPQTLMITVILTPRYTILLFPHACSQMMIVISSNMQKTGFQAVKFLPDILTLTLILSSTSLSSKTTMILNLSFKK